jgi:hypothetical protein
MTDATLFGRWVCPSRVQKHPSTMLKEAPSRFLSSGMARVDNSGPVFHRWALFLSLSPPSKIIVWPSLLLVFQSQSLFIWFFIFYFYFWPFYKSFICFQSHLSIPFRYILFFQFNLHFFLWFLGSFVKLIFLFN